MSRAALTVVLLLALVGQAASAAQRVACPMLDRARAGDEAGCEHCPPPPPEVALRPALPDCCALHAAIAAPAPSEPVRGSQPLSAAALEAHRSVPLPVAVPLLRGPLPGSRAPAPPPPPRNLPLLS